MLDGVLGECEFQGTAYVGRGYSYDQTLSVPIVPPRSTQAKDNFAIAFEPIRIRIRYPGGNTREPRGMRGHRGPTRCALSLARYEVLASRHTTPATPRGRTARATAPTRCAVGPDRPGPVKGPRVYSPSALQYRPARVYKIL